MRTPAIRLTRYTHIPVPHFVLAALFIASIVAVTPHAHAQRFPSDQVYLPAVGYLPGATTFATRVIITNASGDPVSVTSVYAPANTPNPVRIRGDVLHLRPYEVRPIDDFLRDVLHVASGFGMVMFNACREGRDCSVQFPEIDPVGNPNNRPIYVKSRVYSYSTSTSGPTLGQELSGVSWQDAAEAAWMASTLTGIRVGERHRANIGLANGSDRNPITIAVSLYDGADGGLRDQRTLTLTPFQSIQPNILDLFPKLAAWSRLNRGRAVTNAVVVVTQAAGAPTTEPAAIITYASVVDNLSGDAETIEPNVAPIPLSMAAPPVVPMASAMGVVAASHVAFHKD